MNEQNGTNGNGHANGNKGIFDLVQKADPLLSQIVPAARRRVCTMTSICEAARMFYCYLTDMSLLPGVNSRKGVVKFSDYDLAMRFEVSDKTIRNWKRALESNKVIWLTEKFMKNTFPQTVYNITAIVGEPPLPMNVDGDDGSVPEDEVYTSNRRRQRAVRRSNQSGKFTCRIHGEAGCKICRRQTPPTLPMPEVSPEISQNQAENDTAGKILPRTTAIDFRPPRQPFAAHGGNELPSPTAIDFRGGRQMVAVGDGNGLPLSAANGCRGERQTVADNGKTLGLVRGSPRDKKGESTPRNEVEEAAMEEGDTGFMAWCADWKTEFRGKRQKELLRIKGKLAVAPSPFWQRRADFLQVCLDGGKPPVTKPTVRPVKTSTGTTQKLPDEKFDKLAKETLAQMRKAVAH